MANAGRINQDNNYLAAAALQLWADHCFPVRLGVGSWVWLCVNGKAYGSLPNREIDGAPSLTPPRTQSVGRNRGDIAVGDFYFCSSPSKWNLHPH